MEDNTTDFEKNEIDGIEAIDYKEIIVKFCPVCDGRKYITKTNEAGLSSGTICYECKGTGFVEVK